MGSGITIGSKCLMCEGSGYFDPSKPRITCSYCTGTGKTEKRQSPSGKDR
jgi:DnaJ-class molecular chaperone